MATYRGLDGIVRIGADTVGETTSFTVTETGDTIESTAQRATGAARTYLAGLKSFTASVEMHLDADDPGQAHMAKGATVALTLYPKGEDESLQIIEGTGVITNVETTSAFDNQTVGFSIQVQGTAALEKGAGVLAVLVEGAGVTAANGYYSLDNDIWTKGDWTFQNEASPGLVQLQNQGAPVYNSTTNGDQAEPWALTYASIDSADNPPPTVTQTTVIE